MVAADTLRPTSDIDASLATSFYVKYDVKEILGSGASSTVRRCIEKHSQQEFAVKILDLNSGVDDPEIIRIECMREVKILRQASGHPNIIELHDVFEGDAFIFLVFEVCKGGELFDFLSQKVTLSEKRTRQFMGQLLSAIDFIHAQKIVHRDLKPENILLDNDLNIKITDFGLAVFDDNSEELQMIRGTPGYLAPEVLRNGYYEDQPPYGQPVDMWACGVIMYTLLVGCPPFWNRKEHLMLRQIMEGRYSFPSPEWDDISEVTKDLISKMLLTDSSKRIKAQSALDHDFFRQKAAVYSIRFIQALKWMRLRSGFFNLTDLAADPYADRKLRKLIDTLAYDVYSQWVKKGEEQNRAAMFESSPRRDQIDPTSQSEEEDEEAVESLLNIVGLGSPMSTDFDDFDDEELRAPIRLGY